MRYFNMGLIPMVALALTIGCGGGDSTPTATPAPAADTDTEAGSGTETPAADDGSGEKSEEGSGTGQIHFNSENLPTMALLVPTIECEGCAASVMSTLASVDGVEDVSVCVKSKTATLAIDQGSFDAEAAIAALAGNNHEGAELQELPAAPAEG